MPSTVHVQPMTDAIRRIPARWQPNHPPIFDNDPTRADIRLAIDLIEALDADSRAWYASSLERLRADLAASDAAA